MEKVLVIDSTKLSDIISKKQSHYINGVMAIDEQTFCESIYSNICFLDRNDAEIDYSRKQIIPYAYITHENYIFLLKRSTKQSEKRLHNRYSIGAGGHINDIDYVESSHNPIDIFRKGLFRELSEELSFDTKYQIKFIGLINDNSTDVGKVHLGMCYQIILPSKMCTIEEKENMSGQWIKISEIDKYYANLEEWSRIIVDSICK